MFLIEECELERYGIRGTAQVGFNLTLVTANSLFQLMAILLLSKTYNACQESWNTDVNFQGQNQLSPSPLQNNVGLLSNESGF